MSSTSSSFVVSRVVIVVGRRVYSRKIVECALFCMFNSQSNWRFVGIFCGRCVRSESNAIFDSTERARKWHDWKQLNVESVIFNGNCVWNLHLSGILLLELGNKKRLRDHRNTDNYSSSSIPCPSLFVVTVVTVLLQKGSCLDEQHNILDTFQPKQQQQEQNSSDVKNPETWSKQIPSRLVAVQRILCGFVSSYGIFIRILWSMVFFYNFIWIDGFCWFFSIAPNVNAKKRDFLSQVHQILFSNSAWITLCSN